MTNFLVTFFQNSLLFLDVHSFSWTGIGILLPYLDAGHEQLKSPMWGGKIKEGGVQVAKWKCQPHVKVSVVISKLLIYVNAAFIAQYFFSFIFKHMCLYILRIML